MEFTENLLQVIGAIAIGFLFVIIFYRGGSLLPAIAAHSAIDVASAFCKEAGLTPEKRMLIFSIQLAIVVVYTLILLKTLPPQRGFPWGKRSIRKKPSLSWAFCQVCNAQAR